LEREICGKQRRKGNQKKENNEKKSRVIGKKDAVESAVQQFFQKYETVTEFS
jgi:hypothetical protein